MLKNDYALPVLIKAVVKPVNGIVSLKVANPAMISITKFMEDILIHCNTLNPRQKPLFIKDGQFIHAACVAIQQIKAFASCQDTISDKDLTNAIHSGFVTIYISLHIN